MKTCTFLLSLLVLFGITEMAQAQTTPSDADRAAITEAITNYAKGADNQDADRIAKSLDPASMQYVIRPQGALRLSQEQYLGLIKNKKIGGEDREMTIHFIDVTNGNAAIAKVELKGSATFTQYVSLLKGADGWGIVSIATTLK